MLRSVANVTRRDGEEFFRLVERLDIRAEVRRLDFDRLPEGLIQLKFGRIDGAAVLEVGSAG